MSAQPDKTEPHPLLRLVDPRVPLPWLVAAIICAAGMYFQLQSLSEALRDLQIMVRSGNASWVTLAGQQELIKFRVETLEAEAARARGLSPITSRR